MLYEKIDITTSTGNINLRYHYKNIYILNPYNASGFIIINDNEKINISDVDLIEDISGGVKSIQWGISTPDKLPVTIILSNIHLKPRELLFKTEQTLPVDIKNDFINVSVTNSEIPVSITQSVLDVNVNNTSLDVNVTNASFDVNVTNASLDVNVTNATLDVNVSNSSLDVSISNATVTIDTAIADLKTAWPGAQLDYNYVIFYSDSTLTLNNLPYVSAMGPLDDKQILNTPDTLLIDANTFNSGRYVIFKYPLYRPTTDVLYSGNLDDLAPNSSVSNAAAAPPTDYYSTVIDLGTDIANLQNLYLVIYMSIYFTTNSTGGGDITAYFEGSNDQTTWTELYSFRKYGGAGLTISGNTGNVGILVSDKYRYYRFHYHVNVADGLSSYGYTYGLRKVLGW